LSPTVATLAKQPKTWCQQLREALVIGEYDEVIQLVNGLLTEAAETVSVMREMTDRFATQELIRLLDTAAERRSGMGG